MMIVRIDDRRAPREVGQDVDRLTRDAETPWLGVVAIGGERGVADDAIDIRTIAERGAEALDGGGAGGWS